MMIIFALYNKLFPTVQKVDDNRTQTQNHLNKRTKKNLILIFKKLTKCSVIIDCVKQCK